MKNIKNKQGGFTLIEILVVIGIIAVLAAVVLIAINPARQFAQANDSQRQANVNAILNGIGQYMADNSGQIPGSGDIAEGDPETPGDWTNIDDDAQDLCEDLVPTYMPALPVDPEATVDPVDDCTATFDTLYQVIQDEDTGRISVRADGQITTDIVVTR